jgi:GNAT superfamily N-acetyltransferase
VYVVAKEETAELTRIELRLEQLERPLVKRYPPLGEAEVARYAALAAEGHCFGAFADGRCMGIALTEPREWNRSLWVQELHVTEGHRGCGLGRRLLERAVEHARTLRMRCVVCETQSWASRWRAWTSRITRTRIGCGARWRCS